MSERASDALLLAVSVLLTCAFIAYFVNVANSGINLNASAAAQTDRMVTNISEREKMVYDGEIVSGSDVVSCIKNYRDEVTIEVEKYADRTATRTFQFLPYEGEHVSEDDLEYFLSDVFTNKPTNAVNGTNQTNLDYINPNADFLGTVARNENGVIDKITFTQQAYVTDALAATGGVTDSSGTTPPSVSTQLTGLQSSITALQDSVNRLQSGGGISAGGSAGGITSGISAADFEALKTQVTNLGRTVSTLGDDVAELQDSVAGGTGGSGSGDTPVVGPDEEDDENPADDPVDTGLSATVAELETQVAEVITILNGTGGDGIEQSAGLVAIVDDMTLSLQTLADRLDALTTVTSSAEVSSASSFAKLEKSIADLKTSIETINNTLIFNDLMPADSENQEGS